MVDKDCAKLVKYKPQAISNMPATQTKRGPKRSDKIPPPTPKMK